MTNVDLGPDSWMIFDQATKGRLDPGQLHLSRNGKKWKLLKTEDVPEGVHVSGQQLLSLIKATAEGQQEVPEELKSVVDEIEFKSIASDKRFQRLCKLILVEDGETSGVEKVRAERWEELAVLRRAFEHAKKVGKGLARMEELGFEGRFVGQGDAGWKDYLINELVLRGRKNRVAYTADEIRLMTSFWKEYPVSRESPSSARSFAAWVRSKEDEWSTKTGLSSDKEKFLISLAQENAEYKFTEDFFQLEGRHPTEEELSRWRASKDERLERKADELSSMAEPKKTVRGDKKDKREPFAQTLDTPRVVRPGDSQKQAVVFFPYAVAEKADGISPYDMIEEDEDSSPRERMEVAAAASSYERMEATATASSCEVKEQAELSQTHERGEEARVSYGEAFESAAFLDTSSPGPRSLADSPGPAKLEVRKIRQSSTLKLEEGRRKFLARMSAREGEEAKEQKDKWTKFKEFPGASNISFRKYMEWHLRYKESGNPDSEENWMLHKVWEEARSSEKPPITMQKREFNFLRVSDFVTYFQKICFCKEMAKMGGVGVRVWWDRYSSDVEEGFVQWIAKKECEIRDRFSKTHLPVELFDRWRQQQDDSPWMPPRPFVALDEKQRVMYSTKVESGRLFRNGFPYDSGSDHSIFHKGQGIGIFVVGPDEELYCGGHVIDVFHHSSFFGSGAVLCGGEIGTDENGQITFLSNKSGHYTPTEEQNVQMLEWFERRGVNLDEVLFTCFHVGSEKPLEMNARAYLNESKHRAEIVKNQWLTFKQLPGAEAVSLRQYNSWFCENLPPEYQKSKDMWALKKLWEITRFAKDTTYAAALLPEGEDDFRSYVQKISFCRERANAAHVDVTVWLDANLQTFREQFEKWEEEKAYEVRSRFERSCLPISYDKWIEQQDDSEWIPPRGRFLLSAEEKIAYATTVEAGRLVRNGHPYDTCIDRGIAHRERGVGIFVIDINNELHCGGYVEDVFDHMSLCVSSILSIHDFCGEIGTDADGRITVISNKMERTAQCDEQNIRILRYFADKGVDLHSVRFVRYEEGKDAPIEEVASTYLEETERREEALKKEWLAFHELPGAEGLFFYEYKGLVSAYNESEFKGNKEKWLLNKIWEKMRQASKRMDLCVRAQTLGLSPVKEEDFEKYYQQICFCKAAAEKEGLGVQKWHELNKLTFQEQFQQWLESKP